MVVKIKGGFTRWARKTLNSEVFSSKPDSWFKIWFYIVSSVNHTDVENYVKGQRYFTYEMIAESTKATYSQIKHCIEWLKKGKQIATQKKPRGMIIVVLNYIFYQDLENYKTKQIRKTDVLTEGKQKDVLYNKNDKNDKNDKKKERHFVPPTVTEVTKYITEKGYNIDPKIFVEYFSESDWVDSNGKKVRNWKQKVITWNGRNNIKSEDSYTPRKVYT